jgi:hypothetical protein
MRDELRRLAQPSEPCLKTRKYSRTVLYFEDAGGSRTHFKLLCRQLPDRLAPASDEVRSWEWGEGMFNTSNSELDTSHSELLAMSSPGIEPGPRPSQGRVRIRHTPGTVFYLALKDSTCWIASLGNSLP